MKELVKFLNYHTKLYDEGHPEISDKEWDEKYFELLKLEELSGIVLPNSPTHKIKYEIVNELKKVKHNHPMLSLAKTKDWNEFLNYFSSIDSSKDVIGMLKLDGLTCCLTYKDGKLVSAETRGDGLIGEDIFHNAQVIKSVPKYISYKGDLIVDGEIICTYKDFEQFSGEYKNPRNFASGSIRLLDSKECEKRKLTFIPWNVVKGLTNNIIDNFNELVKLGFTVAPWTSSFDYDAKEFLIDSAKELGYPIDGLVGRFNDREFGDSLGSTDHHAKAAYAFKFYDEEYETKLIKIDYDISRNGVLTPVAVFEPLDIDGSTVERASLHNLSVMWDTLGKYPDKGQPIWIFKANQIIPQISRAVKNNIPHDHIINDAVKEYCPICFKKTEIIKSAGGIYNLYCTNPNCEGKLAQQIDHFVGKEGLDVKGLSRATIKKLIDLGWVNSRADIFKLSDYAKEWENLPGFGPKSVSNVINAIETAKNTNFESYLSSLGISLIGQKVSKELSKVFSSYNDFREAIREGYDFNQLEGFGPEMNKALHEYDYTEADEIAEMLTFKQPEVQSSSSTSAAGLIFAITGKLSRKRNEWIKDIEAAGGKVSSSVSSKTNYLVCNDKNSTTGKSADAKKFGTPIISEEELMTLLGKKGK